MGLEDINARDDILPDYKLEVTWENTKVCINYLSIFIKNDVRFNTF